MVTDRASGMELEHRLNSLQTSLTAIEWAITKYENILEDFRMQEETKEVPPLVSTGDAVSPEEEAFLMQQASQPVDPAAGSHSPRSEAGTVSGEMAELSLTSLSQPGPGEDETQQ